MTSLPESFAFLGDGDITLNSTTPADGNLRLSNPASGAGKKLNILGSNATSGDNNGGDINLIPDGSSGSGIGGVVKVADSTTPSNTVAFTVHGGYPRISFGGHSGIINWDSDKNLYFGEDNHYGYMLLRGVMVGIQTSSPIGNFEVAQHNTCPGTVAISNGSTVVTGTNTKFLNTFKVGDQIYPVFNLEVQH